MIVLGVFMVFMNARQLFCLKCDISDRQNLLCVSSHFIFE